MCYTSPEHLLIRPPYKVVHFGFLNLTHDRSRPASFTPQELAYELVVLHLGTQMDPPPYTRKHVQKANVLACIKEKRATANERRITKKLKIKNTKTPRMRHEKWCRTSHNINVICTYQTPYKALNFVKLGVPHPADASHPTAAGSPYVVEPHA
jgi:hypothetical protein